MLLVYETSRLVGWALTYDQITKGVLFYSGYIYGVVNVIVVSRIPNFYYRFLALFSSYLLRYGLFVFVLDPEASGPGEFIRGAIIDLFALYFFYSDEKFQRNVYQKFDEKREELLKFKELLSDTLPQSLTVVDYTTLQPLFSNSMFTSIFLRNPTTVILPENNPQTDNILSLFFVDETTVREMGTPQLCLKTVDADRNAPSLEFVIRKQVELNMLQDKAVCLTASYKKSSQSKSFEVVLKRVKWDRKEAIAIILSDITYQENLIYLRMANANKDRILASVSHELRTPLHGIIGLLEMAERKVQDKEALEYISLSRDNSYLLMSLVNSILDLQQISAGKLKLNTSPINLKKTLTEVIKLFDFQAKQKLLSVTLSIDSDVAEYLRTDENRLKQILINLIYNSIKFTSKGTVSIAVTQNVEEEDFIQISVTDTGIGIKEEDKEKLFNMYGKPELQDGVTKNGAGLGLTASNALAVFLNGRKSQRVIEFTSEYGRGSCFYFEILKDLENPKYIQQEDFVRSKGLKKMSTKESEYLRGSHINVARISSENYTEQDELIASPHKEDDDISETFLATGTVNTKLSRYISHEKIGINELNTQSPINSRSPTHRGVYKRESLMHISASQRHISPMNTEIQEEPSSKRDGTRSHSALVRPSTFGTYLKGLQNKGWILVVDDNPFNLLIAGNLVKESGYNIKTAIGGPEAIDTMKCMFREGQHIRLVLMDCQMPVMDGYETTRVLIDLMNKNEVQKVPIIALTANNSKEDIQKCYDCGMTGHLTKPTSQQELFKALASLN